MKTLADIWKRADTVIFKHPHPEIVDINLTSACNQKCIYCEIGQGLVRQEKTDRTLLNLNDMKWIIDQMIQAGIPALVLQGGEPFLFRDLFPVIEYAAMNRRNISIITNGMKIPQLNDNELKILRDTRCSLSVSIDSFNPETENFIRGVDTAHGNAVEGIRILVQHHIPVTISTVITHYNYQDISQLVKTADSLGVSSVHFQPLINISNYPEAPCIPKKDAMSLLPEHLDSLMQEFETIMTYEKTHTISTNINLLKKWIRQYTVFNSVSDGKTGYFFRNHLNRFFCFELYYRIRINYYGQVLPCHFIHSAVSIRDDPKRTLPETWNLSCTQIRDSIQSQHYPAQCNGCVCSYDMNLLVSMIRYPFQNRKMIARMILDTTT